MPKRKKSPVDKIKHEQKNLKEQFTDQVIKVAKHLGYHIYDQVCGSPKMERYEEIFYECWYDLSQQERDDLYCDNKEEIDKACLRTKFIYNIGCTIFKMFSRLETKTRYEPKYFLLTKNPHNLAERIVDNVYDELTGSSDEEELVRYVKYFFESLTPEQLKSVCEYDKSSHKLPYKKSSLKTKFMGHIGQQVLKWLAPKYF